MAEGRSASHAVKDLTDLCTLQIRTAIEANDLPSIFRPALAHFWAMFFAAKKTRAIRPSRRGPIKEIDKREVELV